MVVARFRNWEARRNRAFYLIACAVVDRTTEETTLENSRNFARL